MILHIDMDAFYASVEQLDNPYFRGKCVIVGGLSDRSVVSAASYEARRFGVHSAMPMYRAKLKCPHGIFLPPRISRYKEISTMIMVRFKNFSPLVEQVSIDEAYIDISDCSKLYGKPVEIAMAIKKNIQQTVNLTCSVGVAPNKVLAKIASDMDKPDGLFVILPENAKDFIESLSLNKLPGVGKSTGKTLELLGIKTVADLKKIPRKMFLKKLGKFGKRLLELADCIDVSSVTPDFQRKSVSTETTFPEDTLNQERLKKYLLIQSEEVARELRKLNVKAKTITLKIKHADFTQKTRSSTIKIPTHQTDIVYQEAVNLLHAYKTKKQIRLIGVGASGFLPLSTPVQMDLFQTTKKKRPNWKKVDKAMDDIIAKFGKDAVKRATLKDNCED
jgi:DNA polymerase-4